MDIGFELQLIWHDNDVLNLRVSAWNGAFGRVAEVYEAVGDLEAAATQLRGFPNSTADRRASGNVHVAPYPNGPSKTASQGSR
jgi:hypothetical protein